MILTFNTLNTTSGCLSTSGLIEINSIELIKQNIVEILIPVNSPSTGTPPLWCSGSILGKHQLIVVWFSLLE